MNLLLLLLLLFLSVHRQIVHTQPIDLSKSKSTKASLNSLKTKPIELITTKLLSLTSLGIGTYYDVAAGLGSCGQLHSNEDMVVAMNVKQMQNSDNPNKNPLCGKKLKIKGKTGHYVTARIVDTCPGCDTGCLDMSSALFKKVCGNLELGVCNISWKFE